MLFLERVQSNVFENGQAHSLIAVFVSRAIFYLKRLGGSPVAFKKCFDFWEREWWSRERYRLYRLGDSDGSPVVLNVYKNENVNNSVVQRFTSHVD